MDAMRHTWLPAGVGVALTVITLFGFARRREARGASEARSTQVVVELFTSEGCSSCPPADATLARLARSSGASTVIPLALHVDYWDDLGWPDPFSSRAYTARQREYAASMGRDGLYTPQAIVDGEAQMNGSDEAGLRRAIALAAARPKAEVTLARGAAPRSLAVRIGALPGGIAGARATLAITEDGLHVDVPRGENAGRRLEHDGVVRELRPIGTVPASGATLETSVRVPAGSRRDRVRFVVVVDDPRTRRVVGVGTLAPAGEFE